MIRVHSVELLFWLAGFTLIGYCIGKGWVFG